MSDDLVCGLWANVTGPTPLTWQGCVIVGTEQDWATGPLVDARRYEGTAPVPEAVETVSFGEWLAGAVPPEMRWQPDA